MTYRAATLLPDARCPRDGHRLEAASAGLPRLVCRPCRGTWIRRAEVATLATTRELQDALTGVDPLPRDYVEDRSKPVACPECQKRLRRYEYGESNLCLDMCRDHGLWLDSRELGQLAAYLRYYAAELAPAEPAGQPELEQKALAGPRLRPPPPVVRKRHQPGILEELFDFVFSGGKS
jgi:Zn-finger nucleic acid-binding protein